MYRIQAKNADTYQRIIATIIQDNPVQYYFRNDKRQLVNIENLSQELYNKLVNLGAVITPETYYEGPDPPPRMPI